MADVAPVSLGQLIKRYRIAAGLTQEELAERASLSARAIRALETGGRRTPRKDTLALLASALNLTPAERGRLEMEARQSRAPERPRINATTRPRERTPLIGRQRERTQIARSLRGEAPPLLLLAGEPGIGKSRLLEEAAEQAEALGWTVLSGGCHRRSAQEPYAPCVEALARFLAIRSPAQQRLDVQGCAWLARLLPELTQHTLVPSLSWTLTPQQERRLMFAAVARFLANIAGPAGTLLILDDLHWAGADALDLLAFLLREESGRPLCVIGAYRDVDVSAHDLLPTLLGDLAREGLATHVPLAPLEGDDAAQLLSRLLADAPEDTSDLRRSILSRAGGVPYYLVSCAQVARGGSQAGSDDALTVPWSVAESIRQRMATLSDAARELLAVGAVVAQAMPRELLRLVAAGLGQSEETTLSALEALTRARLFVERADGSYAFAHDLIRETVEAELGGARRAALHRRIGEALERLPQPERQPAQLAWHFARGDELARALPYALQAGDHAEAIYAHSEAERHFRAAAEWAHALGDQAREGEALEKLADVLYHLTRYQDAYMVLERVISMYQAAGAWERLAWATAQIVRAGDPLGLTAAGLARVERMFALLAAVADGQVDAGQCGMNVVAQADKAKDTAEDTAEDTLEHRAERAASLLTAQTAARVYLCLTSRYLFLDRYAEVSMPSAQAISYAREAGDLRIESLAYSFLARARALQGELAESDELAERARERALASGDLEALHMALGCISTAHELRGYTEGARDATAQIVEVARELGNVGLVGSMQCEQAALSFRLGEWDEARRQLNQAARLLEQHGLAEARSPAIGLALLDLAQGGESAALTATLDEAEDAADGHVWSWAMTLLAERDLLAGKADAAAALTRRAIDRMDQGPIERRYPHALLAWAELERGETLRARETLAQARLAADAQGNHTALIDVERVEALLALRQGRWHDAREALERSLALCLAASAPYAEAKARFVYGDLYAAIDAPERAREQYALALTLCERLGERIYRPHIARALGRLPEA